MRIYIEYYYEQEERIRKIISDLSGAVIKTGKSGFMGCDAPDKSITIEIKRDTYGQYLERLDKDFKDEAPGYPFAIKLNWDEQE